MISSHRIQPLAMYLYRGHSASTSLGKGVGVDEESNKKMILKGWRVVKKCECIFSVTRSLLLLGFS